MFIETRSRAPRDFYIKKTDAERHGYTRGCAGCSSWFRGLGRQPHTEGCRERFRKLMQDEAKVKLAQSRKEEFEEKEATKKKRKAAKKEDKARRKRDAEEDTGDGERAGQENEESDEEVKKGRRRRRRTTRSV